MILIPLGTDAPIYHWPKATLLMIVVNVVLYFAVPPGGLAFSDEEEDEPVAVATPFERYSLTLGNGLHPVQWLTHNFLHFGIVHLAGNMLFLWSFGIVVEGKLGMLKFLTAYLALGTLHGALVQTLMLHSTPVAQAAGASAVIYGLLAICMVWAPRNELNCLVLIFLGIRAMVFNWELRYTTVALLYVGEQVLNLFWMGLTGRHAISELGHLSGALWGTVLAAAIVKFGWVDCEGWDIFSLWAKRRQLAADWKRRGEMLDRRKQPAKRPKRRDASDEASPEEQAEKAVKRVKKLIEMGDMEGAISAYDRSARTLVRWPAQADLLAFIKAMHAQQAEVESLPLMRDFCRKYPEAATRVRLKLAQVLIRDRQRPAAALQVLAGLEPQSLTPELEARRRQLAQQATRMQAEGVLELEGDDY